MTETFEELFEITYHRTKYAFTYGLELTVTKTIGKDYQNRDAKIQYASGTLFKEGSGTLFKEGCSRIDFSLELTTKEDWDTHHRLMNRLYEIKEDYKD